MTAPQPGFIRLATVVVPPEQPAHRRECPLIEFRIKLDGPSAPAARHSRAVPQWLRPVPAACFLSSVPCSCLAQVRPLPSLTVRRTKTGSAFFSFGSDWRRRSVVGAPCAVGGSTLWRMSRNATRGGSLLVPTSISRRALRFQQKAGFKYELFSSARAVPRSVRSLWMADCFEPVGGGCDARSASLPSLIVSYCGQPIGATSKRGGNHQCGKLTLASNKLIDEILF